MTRRLTAFVKLILLLLALGSPMLTYQSFSRERELLRYREEIIASHAGERDRIVGDVAQRFFSETPRLAAARLQRHLPNGALVGLGELPPPDQFLSWGEVRAGETTEADPRLLQLLHDDESFPSGMPCRFAGMVELFRAKNVVLAPGDFQRFYHVASGFWTGEGLDDVSFAFLLEKLPIETRCRFDEQLRFLGLDQPEGESQAMIRLKHNDTSYLVNLSVNELNELNDRLAAFSPGLRLVLSPRWQVFAPVEATLTVELGNLAVPRHTVALRYLYSGLGLELVILLVYLVLTRYEKVHTTQKRLLATTSHELRTPLAVIRQFAEMLVDRSDQVSERLGKYHRHILRESVKMQFLVENLLSASRFENLKITPNFEQIELGDWLEELRESAARLSEHQVRLNTPQLSVTWDRTLMAQVLTNIMENARVHAGTDLEITVHQQGDQVQLDCRDYGKTPDLRDLERIRAFKSRGQRGLGLGLFLSQRILAIHAGKLRFSDAEPGLRVTITLPRHVRNP